MNGLLRLEAAVLLTGWLLGFAFVLYSEGVFDLSHQWSWMDVGFFVLAVLLAAPYVLAGWFCWLLKRFVGLFLMMSVVIVVGSFFAYRSVYFPQPQDDAGWIFMIVPAIQTAIVSVFSGVVFLLGKLRPR
jgi:hypothetical protein